MITAQGEAGCVPAKRGRGWMEEWRSSSVVFRPCRPAPPPQPRCASSTQAAKSSADNAELPGSKDQWGVDS